MATMTPGGLDFVDRAPLRVVTEVSLRQPPQQVWDVLVDNERWPEWFSACAAARTTSDVATGVGSTRWVHVDIFEANERFIVWEEPEQWGFTLLDANLPLADTVVELARLTPDGAGTRLTYTFAVAPKPWFRPLTPIFRRQFSGMFRTSLVGLQPSLDHRVATATD